jgi:hypothetical protein
MAAKSRHSPAFELGRAIGDATGLTKAVAETGDLAKAWGNVAKNAAVAQRAIGQASSAAVRTAPAAASLAAGGGGGRHRPGWLRGHISGPGAPIPGLQGAMFQLMLAREAIEDLFENLPSAEVQAKGS